HDFIDLKKAFDSVWHAALWAAMKKYNMRTNLIRIIRNLYITRPLEQSSSTAGLETGSEQQSESDRDV
ncbi:hypothetical protein, partial [Thiolapillus sp.]|uniref:hypothetical protein n=1 Tax=Thiolapillus sp. TaxID=2017437 RepID=UPI003AF5B090